MTMSRPYLVLLPNPYTPHKSFIMSMDEIAKQVSYAFRYAC